MKRKKGERRKDKKEKYMKKTNSSRERRTKKDKYGGDNDNDVLYADENVKTIKWHVYAFDKQNCSTV